MKDKIQSAFENFIERAWNDPNARIIQAESRGGGDGTRGIKLTKKELKGFRRVKPDPDDTEVPFYKFRSECSENWYVASDLLINVFENGNASWVKGRPDCNGRLLHSIEKTHGITQLYLATIYGVTTATAETMKELVPLEADRKALEAEGLKAMRRMIQHHPQGHIPLDKCSSERAYNQRNRVIQIINREAHKTVHMRQKLTRCEAEDLRKVQNLDVDNNTALILNFDKSTGELKECGYKDMGVVVRSLWRSQEEISKLIEQGRIRVLNGVVYAVEILEDGTEQLEPIRRTEQAISGI